MVVALTLHHVEHDHDPRMERRDAARLEIATGVEVKAIRASLGWRIRRERAEPTVGIGLAAANQLPVVRRALPLERDRHAGRWSAERRVEHVSGDAAQGS